MKVTGVPFTDHSYTTTHFLMANKNETEMIFKGVDKSKGIPYSESFETHTKWEIYAPFPNADKVVMVHSFTIYWISKPFLVAGVIESAIKSKLGDSIQAMRSFYMDKARDIATVNSLSKSKNSAENSELLTQMIEENAKRTEEM